MEMTIERQEALQELIDRIVDGLVQGYERFMKMCEAITKAFCEFWAKLRPFLDALQQLGIKWSESPSKWKHYALTCKRRRIRAKYIKRIFEE